MIGIGGMGAVYEARHRNGMRCAVKVLDVAGSRSREWRARFHREGRLANEVSHVGAVRVLDDDETEDGSAFLVMELLVGSTLDQLAMERGGTLPPAELLRCAAQVLDTLVAAHARGIVHRDIKPDNLMLTTEGIVKILDFGIAWWDALGESRRLTHVGEPIGTPAFMPPEQARGHWHLVDAQSDLYALGATMFTLAIGETVHDDEMSVADLLVSIITRPARPVKRTDDVPEALAAIIDKALSYDKRGRFANALAMREAVEAAHVAITGKPIPPTPTSSVSNDALLGVTRFATTMKRRVSRTARILTLVTPCAVVIACAFVVNASARTRGDATPTPAIAERATIDAPPPPARIAFEITEEEESTPAATANVARTTPVMTSPAHAPSNTSVVSHLSRRNHLYERRH